MKRFALRLGTGALVSTLLACAQQGDAPLAPQSVSFQVNAVDSAQIAAQVAGDAAVSDVNGFNSCTPDGNGRFDCPPRVNANGVTVVRSLAFYDATGAQMDHFDSTTASMNVQSTENGVIVRDNGADTVSGSRNVTATGLLGHNTTRIWNGTGSGTGGKYWSDSVATRTADVTWNSTFGDVVVALPRSANPYPVSGTIIRLVSGSGVVTKGDSTRTITISRTVVITFNGTEFVPMTVGSQNFTLDLATGKATKN